MSIPTTLAEITPEWLTEALAGRFPGARVTACQPGIIVNGMATKAQYKLTYAAAEDGLPSGPASLWIKGGFEAHSRAQPLALANEAYFFRDIRPRLCIECPESYYAVFDAEAANGIVLMEDLLTRRVTFCNVAAGLDADATANVLELQARLHARFWASPELGQFAWLSSGGSIAEDGVIDLFLGLWDGAERLPRFAEVPPKLRHRERNRAALFRMFDLARAMPICLVHGDTHAGNLYFDPCGVPGYLDWQQVMKGPWAHDVAGFLITALEADQRRIHERSLLVHYLDCLRAAGADAPSFDAAWDAYRRHAMWTFLWTLCPTAFHPESTCVAVSRRACAAIDDLESLTLLSS